MTPKVPTSESGTAIEGMMVAQTSRRKRKTTSTTSRTLIMSEISTSWTLERMVVVRSTATSILMVGGMEACRRGIWAITASTVSMTLAPGILKMTIRMASLSWPGGPLAGLMPETPAVWMSATLSTIVPRSETRTGAPVC